MTGSASRHMTPRALESMQLGNWALGTSDRGGQDKANLRSRILRPAAVEKCLSAHWF